jgi:hypothetical protein
VERNLELLLVWPGEESKRFYERAGFEPPHGVAVLGLRPFDAPATPLGTDAE